MTRRIIAGSIVTLAALAAALPAAAQEVHVDYDRAADFPSFKSFAWKDVKAGSLEGSNDLVHTRIVKAIENQLAQAGLAESESAPDLLVTYHASTKQDVRVDTTMYNYGYGSSWYWDPYWGSTYGSGFATGTSQVVTYTRGTLVVDIIDAKTSKLVFRGVAEDIVPDSPSKAEKLIYKCIEKMAKQFRNFRARDKKEAEKAAKKAAKEAEKSKS
jgi:hypothetical protein